MQRNTLLQNDRKSLLSFNTSEKFSQCTCPGNFKLITADSAPSLTAFNTINISIYLPAGNTCVQIQGSDVPITVSDIFLIDNAPSKLTVYSASESILSGGVSLIFDETADIPMQISGHENGGEIEFPSVWAENTGNYILIISYYTDDRVPARLQVNQQAISELDFLATCDMPIPGWNPPFKKEVLVHLHAGKNRLRFFLDSEKCPRLTSIALQKNVN